MNKNVKNAVSLFLVASMAVGMTGCSKSAKECKENGQEFIELAFEREIGDMIDMCDDEDDAYEALHMYEAEYEAVDLLLERATVKPGKATMDGDKATVVFTITLPDYDAALDEDPDDVDDFEDILDDLKDTVDIEVTLKFKKNKKDKWLITNADDFADDFYGELYDIDFPFESPLASRVDRLLWYYYDRTDNDIVIYDCYSDEIDLDVIFMDGTDYSDVYYTVARDGRLVYTSERGHRMGYFHYYDDDNSTNGYVSAGNYTISFYDGNGRFIASDSCVVE